MKIKSRQCSAMSLVWPTMFLPLQFAHRETVPAASTAGHTFLLARPSHSVNSCHIERLNAALSIRSCTPGSEGMPVCLEKAPKDPVSGILNATLDWQVTRNTERQPSRPMSPSCLSPALVLVAWWGISSVRLVAPAACRYLNHHPPPLFTSCRASLESFDVHPKWP